MSQKADRAFESVDPGEGQPVDRKRQGPGRTPGDKKRNYWSRRKAARRYDAKHRAGK
jgi:hypothetical protein